MNNTVMSSPNNMLCKDTQYNDNVHPQTNTPIF